MIRFVKNFLYLYCYTKKIPPEVIIKMQKYLIKTKRLGLRFIHQSDLEHLQKIDKDPEVKKFFPEGVLSDKEIKATIRECYEECKYRNLPCFIIFDLKTETVAGEAYFSTLDTGEVKVGYLFRKKLWGKGYAPETLNALLAWAKEHIDADYIYAYADKDNKASFKVMEKCGMEYYKDEQYLGMDCKFYRIKNQ